MDKKIIVHRSLLLPRAEKVIQETISRLWTVKFETDPLMHMNQILHGVDLGFSQKT